MPRSSQETIAMTLFADRPTLIFVDVDSPGEIQCKSTIRPRLYGAKIRPGYG